MRRLIDIFKNRKHYTNAVFLLSIVYIYIALHFARSFNDERNKNY